MREMWQWLTQCVEKMMNCLTLEIENEKRKCKEKRGKYALEYYVLVMCDHLTVEA